MDERAALAHYIRLIEATDDPQVLLDLNVKIQYSHDLGIDDEHDLSRLINERLAGMGVPKTRLPSGLELCKYCGGVRDAKPGGLRSVCVCAGIVCRYCRAGRVHRPISDHYELKDRRFWHQPYIGGHVGCSACSDLARRLAPELTGWPTCASDARTAPIFDAVRDAARTLSEPRFRFDEEHGPYALLALHGDVEQWHWLRLGAPPDGRPLFVGPSLPVDDELDRRDLRVATWQAPEAGPPLETVLHELLLRWRPPLNNEVWTPWSDEPRPARGTEVLAP